MPSHAARRPVPEKPPRRPRDRRYAGGSRSWPPSTSRPFACCIGPRPSRRRTRLRSDLGLAQFLLARLAAAPAHTGALSLAMIVVLILLSQFKHDVLMMTATFVDVMIIDFATFSFLLTIIPGPRLDGRSGRCSGIPVLVASLAGRAVPRTAQHRGDRRPAVLRCARRLLSFALPTDREDEFHRHQYVSKFARSGAVAAIDLMTRGVLEADATLRPARHSAARRCRAGRQAAAHRHGVRRVRASTSPWSRTSRCRRTTATGSARPTARRRSFVVEGAGGPSWYTEYNVLTGLSVRSYGRFANPSPGWPPVGSSADCPMCCERCGYKTYSLYSWFGAFVGARGFQTSAGIEHFLDARQLRTGPADTDSFFYDHAARVIARERDNGPVFVLRLSHDQPLSLGLPLSSRPAARMGRPRKSVRDRRISAPPGDERARLRAIQAAPCARISATSQFFLVRFGDHQPIFRQAHPGPALDEAEVAGISSSAIRAISPPITRPTG